MLAIEREKQALMKKEKNLKMFIRYVILFCIHTQIMLEQKIYAIVNTLSSYFVKRNIEFQSHI